MSESLFQRRSVGRDSDDSDDIDYRTNSRIRAQSIILWTVLPRTRVLALQGTVWKSLEGVWVTSAFPFSRVQDASLMDSHPRQPHSMFKGPFSTNLKPKPEVCLFIRNRLV